jgi:hypothetical protein
VRGHRHLLRVVPRAKGRLARPHQRPAVRVGFANVMM